MNTNINPFLSEMYLKNRANRLDLYQYSYKLRLKNFRNLGQSKKHLIKQWTDEIRKHLVDNHSHIFRHAFADKEKRKFIYDIIKQYLLTNKAIVPDISSEELLAIVGDNILGFGIIQPLIDDPDVTDIFINGQKEVIYEKFGREMTWHSRFESEEDIQELAYKIVNNSGESLTTAKPKVDCQFPYIRINISLNAIAGLGTTISIRKAAPYLRASEENMLKTNQASKEMLNFLEAAVVAGCNILVTGATGSGKTELLKYLASKIPNRQRTLVVEDNAELYLHKIFPDKHFVPMECRKSTDQESSIEFEDLLENALRQTIKRLIVGEARGKEAMQMIEFFQSGHPGATSIHAVSAVKAIKRLTMMCLRAGMDIKAEHIQELISDTFDIIIFQEKKEDGYRYITEIIELEGYKNGEIQYRNLYSFQPNGYEEGENGEILKINGIHVNEGTMSQTLYKKFRTSIVDANLYEHLSPLRKVEVNKGA